MVATPHRVGAGRVHRPPAADAASMPRGSGRRPPSSGSAAGTSDLRRIADYQNNGDVTRIYTYAMADRFETDLRQLKTEFRI